MSRIHLATYLNDHLAGSVVALEMMDHIEKTHSGSEVAHLVASLRGDVLADRVDLEGLMARLSIDVSSTRKAIAWLSEKSVEIKLKIDDQADGPLHLLEAVEAIAIGIHGKAGLWSALAAANVPEIPAVELARLERRAIEQRNRIENLRLQAARAALQEGQ